MLASEAEEIQKEALKYVFCKIMVKIKRSAQEGANSIDVEIPWGSQRLLCEMLSEKGFSSNPYRYDKYFWKVVMRLQIWWK